MVGEWGWPVTLHGCTRSREWCQAIKPQAHTHISSTQAQLHNGFIASPNSVTCWGPNTGVRGEGGSFCILTTRTFFEEVGITESQTTEVEGSPTTFTFTTAVRGESDFYQWVTQTQHIWSIEFSKKTHTQWKAEQRNPSHRVSTVDSNWWKREFEEWRRKTNEEKERILRM